MRRLLAVAGAMVLAGCSADSAEQVSWADSPDHQVHAIVAETNGGATTSYGYRVDLHPAGHQGERPVAAGFLYGATRSGCSYGVDLRWRDPRTLEIRYRVAERVDVPASVTVGDRRVRLVVRSGVVNDAAACGAMRRI